MNNEDQKLLGALCSDVDNLCNSVERLTTKIDSLEDKIDEADDILHKRINGISREQSKQKGFLVGFVLLFPMISGALFWFLNLFNKNS